MDHPLLRDVSLEQVIRYTLRFMALHGYPALYMDKEGEVGIHDYRGVLPCGLISITQARDAETGAYLRSMQDTFRPRVPRNAPHGEESFKVQGGVMYTSFPEGRV